MRRLAIAAAIGVRSDYTSTDLRRFARGCRDGDQVRRVLALAVILNDEQRARLTAQVEAGPIPAVHGVVRWRLVDQGQWVAGAFSP